MDTTCSHHMTRDLSGDVVFFCWAVYHHLVSGSGHTKLHAVSRSINVTVQVVAVVNKLLWGWLSMLIWRHGQSRWTHDLSCLPGVKSWTSADHTIHQPPPCWCFVECTDYLALTFHLCGTSVGPLSVLCGFSVSSRTDEIATPMSYILFFSLTWTEQRTWSELYTFSSTTFVTLFSLCEDDVFRCWSLSMKAGD